MKKLLTLLSAALLIQAGDALAKVHKIRIDPSHLPAGVSAERINRALQSFSASNVNGGLSKSTSAERVATITNFDFSMPPGSQVMDTVRLKYLSGRGSNFDFSNLYYDFYNHSEHPNPFIFNTNNVQFDTALNAVSGAKMAIRACDAAGKVAQYQDDTMLIQYAYDASNRPITITFSQYDATSGGWVSNYRDLYNYNAAGQLTLDSVEQWDGSAWQQAEELRYTYDGSGRVSFLSVEYRFSNGSIYTIAHQRVSYSGNMTSPSLIVTELTNGHGLDSNYREEFTYSNGARISYDAYTWSGAWDLYSQERRHLNAANLPDSVFFRYWNTGQAVDSFYAKLAYNGQNNPLYRMDYDLITHQPFVGASWTYESTNPTSVDHVKTERLEFYPNPASENIHLKSVNGGSFSIYNTAGQLVLGGKMQNDAIIPVQAITPGMYLIQVRGTDGKQLQASFIRQ